MFSGFGKDGSKGDHIMISSMNFFFYSWLHGGGCEAYPFQSLMFMVATDDYTFSSGSVIHTNQWHVVTFPPSVHVIEDRYHQSSCKLLNEIHQHTDTTFP